MDNLKPSFKFHGSVRELMSLESMITIADNRTALIENCTSITECNEILARVRTKDFEIEIWGRDLCLGSYKTKSVSVSGNIDSININRISSKKENSNAQQI